MNTTKNPSETIKGNKKLPRNVILLGFVSFIADFSSEIYFAILPFFIIYLGGSSIAIGLIAGISDGFLSFLKALFGFISDKLAHARKKFLYWGYGLPALFKFLMAFVTSWPMLILIRTFERIGKGIRSAPRDALLVESVDQDIMGKAFGFHRAMDSFGAVIGSLTALILIFVGLSYPSMIIISSIIAIFTFLPIYFIKDTKFTVPDKSQKELIDLRDFINNGASNTYWKLIIIAGFHGLSMISYMFFILYTENFDFQGIPFLSNANLAQIGIAFYLFFNVIYTIISYYGGLLADKKSKIFVLRIGFLIYFLSILLFIVSKSFDLLVLSFLLWGIAYGLNEGNLRAIISEHIHKKYHATAYGIFHGVIGIAIFAGNIIVGLLYYVKPVYGFIYTGIFALFAFILVTIIRMNNSPNEKKSDFSKRIS